MDDTQKWLGCVLVLDSENSLTVLCDKTESHRPLCLHVPTGLCTSLGTPSVLVARNGTRDSATEVLPRLVGIEGHPEAPDTLLWPQLEGLSCHKAPGDMMSHTETTLLAKGRGWALHSQT